MAGCYQHRSRPLPPGVPQYALSPASGLSADVAGDDLLSRAWPPPLARPFPDIPVSRLRGYLLPITTRHMAGYSCCRRYHGESAPHRRTGRTAGLALGKAADDCTGSSHTGRRYTAPSNAKRSADGEGGSDLPGARQRLPTPEPPSSASIQQLLLGRLSDVVLARISRGH